MTDQPDRPRRPRRPGGAVHRGMVWLLRHEPRWLVDLLVRRKLVAPDLFIEMLPTEAWPVGEENRNREIRADLVMRLWRIPPPEGPSLQAIHESVVIGLIVDFQNRADPTKEIRLLEYESAYPPVVGPNICVVVMTFDEQVARWARIVLRQLRRTVQRSVLTPDWIPRSGPIDPSKAPRHALLEAMCHARGPDDLELLKNALRALRSFSGNELLIYRQMLLSRFDEDRIMEAFHELEAELEDWADYQPTAEELRSFLYVRGERAGLEQGLERGLEQGLERGELIGRAHALLDVLRDRGFEPDPDTEARILECRELARLRHWLVLAMTIDRLDALFDD